MSSSLIFRQLFEKESSTYTYLLGCPKTREAVLIDPVLETAERDARVIQQLKLKLKFAMNTHVHADHITGTGKLKQLIPEAKSLISKVANAKADVLCEHGSKITFGDLSLEARSTPGHTDGCTTYVLHSHKMAFTGDALLIRGCGRTDFQQGSPKTLYNSVHTQILSLSDDFRLFPAHDYTGQTCTSVAEEKEFNARLTKTEAEFVDIMNNLNLPYPKKIDASVPANLVCGIQEAVSS